MKTIDEVIKALEYCTGFDFVRCQDCPGYSEPDCGVQDDALHYLKAYQWQMTNPDGDHQQLEKCRALLSEFYRNDPLSWDELRTMEGKPVWVEDEDCYSKWEIINGVYDDGISFGDYFLNKDEFGTVWQAYRKERE